jgi:hypothetical protein
MRMNKNWDWRDGRALSSELRDDLEGIAAFRSEVIAFPRSQICLLGYYRLWLWYLHCFKYQKRSKTRVIEQQDMFEKMKLTDH